MIRPSARCLGLSAAAFALSMTAVSAGGAARDSALLVWPVLGALIVLDLLTSFRRGLDVVGNAPHQVFAGEEDRLDLEIDRAPEGLRCRLGWPDGLDGPAEEAFSSRSDGPAVARIPFVARRRGRWQIARIWLVWRSRFGLLEFAPCVPVGIDVAVVPNLRPVTSGVIDVAVRSQLFGTKDNPVKGEGSEFHQLRDFTAGMDIRAIDWKRSARYRSLVAKEMRAERNHHVIIALDNGYLKIGRAHV